MRVVSYQHKSVLDTINKEGRYFCTYNSNYRSDAPKIYSYLQELVLDKTGIDSFPIFSYGLLINKDWKVIDLTNPSEDLIHWSWQKVSFDFEDYYFFFLDIPDDLIVSHDFYDFACFKVDEFECLVTDKQLKDFIFEDQIKVKDVPSVGRDVQTCFPYIDKSFIKGVYSFKVERELYGSTKVFFEDAILPLSYDENSSDCVIKKSSIFSN